MANKKPSLDLTKFRRILKRFAERLREAREPKAAEAVESVLKYVNGHDGCLD